MTSPMTLTLDGMTCGGCASRAQRALDAVEGLDEVSVNLATHRAQFTPRDDIGLTRALNALSEAGYPARGVHPVVRVWSALWGVLLGSRRPQSIWHKTRRMCRGLRG